MWLCLFSVLSIAPPVEHQRVKLDLTSSCCQLFLTSKAYLTRGCPFLLFLNSTFFLVHWPDVVVIGSDRPLTLYTRVRLTGAHLLDSSVQSTILDCM